MNPLNVFYGANSITNDKAIAADAKWIRNDAFLSDLNRVPVVYNYMSDFWIICLTEALRIYQLIVVVSCGLYLIYYTH